MTNKEPNISKLINSVLYFLDHALIKIENRKVRLLAVHNRRKLIDKTFETLRGARIAFAKLFPEKMFESTTAEWSHLYPPEPAWLGKMVHMPFKMKEAIDARNRKPVGRTQAH
jgi:hypothetical protein